MPRRVCLKSPARRNYLLTDPGFPGTAAPWGSGLPCHAECQDTPPGRRQEQAPKGPGRGDPGEPRRTRSGELCEPLQAPREMCVCPHVPTRAHTRPGVHGRSRFHRQPPMGTPAQGPLVLGETQRSVLEAAPCEPGSLRPSPRGTRAASCSSQIQRPASLRW